MQDKDSLIEKLAAANKLKAASAVNTPASSSGGSTHKSSSSGSHAPAPPAFLTKEGAASLFGLSSQPAAAKTPVTHEIAEPAKPTFIAPAPTHDELLREIQKLERLGDKKESPEPITVMATSAEAATVKAVKTPSVKPSWRSWLLPRGVALAGIACISVLPKSAEMPQVASKPAVIQKVAVQKGDVSGVVSAPVVSQAATPVIAAVLEPKTPEPAKPNAVAAAIEPAPTPPPTVLARPNEPVAVKVTATPSNKSPAVAKKQAEEAIASAKKVVPPKTVAPKINKNTNDKNSQADQRVAHGNGHNSLDVPRVPVMAVAAVPAAAMAPVISSKAVAKGPDQCAGMTGMAADQCRQCHDFSFIRRLSCEGQIRVKYCEGREGMTRECPLQVDKRH